MIENATDSAQRPVMRAIREFVSPVPGMMSPYPDPEKPGCYRVPLRGYTAYREAIIDAQDLHHVEVILGIKGDAGKVGFRNDNPLDCRRENMIIRTSSEMNMNKRKQATINGKPCSSRYKGVCLESRSGRWLVAIRKDGVTRRLGTFRDELAAAQAYDQAALELFGEHARINFPKGVDEQLERQAA